MLSSLQVDKSNKKRESSMKISRRISRAVKDMEKFTDLTDGKYSFVYRYGVVSSGVREGRVIAWFHASTEAKLNRKIGILDATFREYTDTIVDREYSGSSECWYATYLVLYPFDKSSMSGKFDGQRALPLF